MAIGGALLVVATMLLVAACTARPLEPGAMATAAEAPPATAKATVVDAAFLDEQAAKAYFPSDHGAVMIAVIDADGTAVSASRTADPNDD